jgi:transposase-like protein
MYSMDYRRGAVAYKEKGHTLNELEEAFGIPPETYYQWKRKLESGYYEQNIVRERRRKIDKEKLKHAVAENPDIYLRELAEQFDCSETAVFYALEKLNITRKKRLLPILKNRKSNGKHIQKG